MQPKTINATEPLRRASKYTGNSKPSNVASAASNPARAKPLCADVPYCVGTKITK
jgi:hypothetical protein